MEKLDGSPALRAERDAAAAHFFVNREPDDASSARFEEWFLFERRSPGFGDVPAHVALTTTGATPDNAAVRDMLDELGASHYGVFEVAKDEGRFRVRDVRHGREFELDEEQADQFATELDDGALLVGRLFATPRGSHLFGSGAAVVSGDVASALRQDLTRDAAGDRKSKLSQLEMEKLLFHELGAGGRTRLDGAAAEREPAAADGGAEPLERLEAEIESWLRDSGIAGLDMDELRARFEEAPSMAEVVGPLLEEIAFETQADLEAGRRLLPAYYESLRASRQGTRTASRSAARDELREKAEGPCRCGSGKLYSECCLPRDAVARFEAGRALGQDLTELIHGLESAMGLDNTDDDDAEHDDSRPEPPVAPMVEEYLWECGRLGRELAPAGAAFLRRFAKSLDDGEGAPLDLTEVQPAHVARFLFADRYTEARAPGPDAAEAELNALRDFTAWLRDEQGVDWTTFAGPLCQQEAATAPRLAKANALLGAVDARRWNHAFQVTRLTRRGSAFEAEIEAVDAPAMRGTIVVPAMLSELLEAGDCLAVAADVDIGRLLPSTRWASGNGGDGANVQAQLLRVLPPGAREFLAASTRRTR
jgi:hypothetical protein